MIYFESIQEVTPSELIGQLNDIEKKFAPSHLYIKGDSNIIHTGPRVSVIGSRQASKEGLDNAYRLTRFLVEKQVTIVSGLALGIDTVAHRTAIEQGGKTIAVLGTPLDKSYPQENRSLQEEIMKNHLAISQFQQGSPIQRKNFPLRNRTMALLSHASVIVEAGDTSGSLHQGWEALRLGRRLFIMESIMRDKSLKWPLEMIRYGAEVLTIDKMELLLEALPVPEELVGTDVAF